MTTKKKRNVAIALVVGVMTLTTAVFANYSNANGYTVYKDAMKKLFKADNYTANYGIELTVDGKQVEFGEATEMVDLNGDVKTSIVSNSLNGRWETYTYQDGKAIVKYDKDDYRVYESLAPRAAFNMTQNIGGDEETADKYIKFAELAMDMFVGDMKNNFTFVSQEDGISTYDLSLEGIQIPEIVNAGLNLLTTSPYDSSEIDELAEEYAGDPAYILWKCSDVSATNAECMVKVDEEGRIVQNILKGSMTGVEKNGTTHTIELTIKLNVSEYGSTHPQRVDLDSIKYVIDDEEGNTIMVNPDGTTQVIYSRSKGNGDESVEITYPEDVQ